jgi:uncharacterized protein YegP (UPF0339 family)
MKIEIFPRWGLLGKRWYFRFVAVNGECIAVSQAYTRRQHAVDTADTISKQAGTARIYLFEE